LKLQQIQPAQPVQPQTDELVGDIVRLAWDIWLKTLEPKWKKSSPGSLLAYKLSDKLSASPTLSPEGRQLANVIKAVAFLYGLDKSDN
jgi:hypothetical protein